MSLFTLYGSSLLCNIALLLQPFHRIALCFFKQPYMMPSCVREYVQLHLGAMFFCCQQLLASFVAVWMLLGCRKSFSFVSWTVAVQ